MRFESMTLIRASAVTSQSEPKQSSERDSQHKTSLMDGAYSVCHLKTGEKYSFIE